jgi:hypothetical protein
MTFYVYGKNAPLTCEFCVNLVLFDPGRFLHDPLSSFLKLRFYNQVIQLRLFDLELQLATLYQTNR